MSNWDVFRNCSPSVPFFDESPLHKCSFEALLLDAIEEALSSFGDSAKQTVYFHLEKTFNIEKQSIPQKIDEFVKALEKIFGLGAKLLEIEIMKRLHLKLGHASKYFPKADALVFTEYIMATKLSSTLADDTALKNNERASE